MKLEKLLDYLTICQGITEFTSPAEVSSLEKNLKYTGVLSNLNGWTKSGYAEEKKIPNNETRLGGPKKLFKLSNKGIELVEELLKKCIKILGSKYESFQNVRTKTEKMKWSAEDVNGFLMGITDELAGLVKDKESLVELQRLLLKELKGL